MLSSSSSLSRWAQVLHWAERAPVLGVMNLNSAIHVVQLDVGAAGAKFSSQFLADELVSIHMQSEIVIDSTRNRAGFNFRFRIRRNREIHGSVYRIQLDRISGKRIKPRVQASIDGRQAR